MNSRLEQLRSRLKNPALIKKKENLYYLTGHAFDLRAQEYLLVKPSSRPSPRGRGRDFGAVAFGSGLEQIDWLKKTDQLKNIGKYVRGKLGIEWGFTFGEAKYLKFKIKNLKLKPEISPVDEMRQVKDAEEISRVRKSMQIVEKVFKQVRREIKKPGMTEFRLAKFIESSGYKLGAQDLAFPAIVASGANAAIPHHVPSSKKLKAGESIIVDFGFKYKHYCSDFTRTVFLKKVPKKLEMAYNQVEKAYNGTIEFITSSVIPAKSAFGGREPESKIKDSRFRGNDNFVTGNDAYQKAVNILAEKHLDKYFIHSLGHGTGLEIHELPNLSPKSKDLLQNNMVFSIEPGVYFPRLGGIRIEDLVYLEGGKVKRFINLPTKLINNIL